MSDNFQCRQTATLPGAIEVQLYESARSKLKIVVAQVPSPIVNINVTIPTEAYTHEGEPHCLEHLIFRGSDKYPVAGYLDSLVALSLASGTNACTDTDKTYYTASMVGMEAFKRIMPVYLDHIFHPLLREEDFRTEVYQLGTDSTVLDAAASSSVASVATPSGVVYSEMETYMSDPNFVADYKLHELAYSVESKYHYNTGGIPSHIVNLTNQKVKAMHSKLYKLEHAVISIIGHISVEEALEVIAKFEQEEINAIQNSKTDEPIPIDSPSTPTDSIHVHPKSDKVVEYYSAESAEEDVIAVLGFRCVNSWLDVEQRLGLEILLSYLTEGSSAPLMKALIENPNTEENIAADLEVETHDYEYDLIAFTFTDVVIESNERGRHSLLKRFLAVIRKLCEEGELDMDKISSLIKREIRCEISDLQKKPHATLEDRLTCWATMLGNGKANSSLFRNILCPDIVLRNLLRMNDPNFFIKILQDVFLNNQSYQVWMKPKKSASLNKTAMPNAIKNLQYHESGSPRNGFAIQDLERKRQLRNFLGDVRGLELNVNFGSSLLPQKVDLPMGNCASLVLDQQGRSDYIEMSIMTEIPITLRRQTILAFLESHLSDGDNSDQISPNTIEIVKTELTGSTSGEGSSPLEDCLRFVLRSFTMDLLIPIMTYVMESPASVILKRGDLHTEEILKLDSKKICCDNSMESSDVVKIDYVKWDEILTSYVLDFSVDEGIPAAGDGGVSHPVYKASIECGLDDFGHVLALLKSYLIGATTDLDRMRVKIRRLISQLNGAIRTGESVVRSLNTLISFGRARNDHGSQENQTVDGVLNLNRENIVLLSTLSRVILAYPDLFLPIFTSLLKTLNVEGLLAQSAPRIVALSVGNMSSMRSEVMQQISKYFPNLAQIRTSELSMSDMRSTVRPIPRQPSLQLPMDMYLNLPNLETGHIEWTCAVPIEGLFAQPEPNDSHNPNEMFYLNCHLIEVITAYLQSEQGPIFQPVRDNGYSYCPTFYYDLDSQCITLRLFDCSQPHEALKCAINSLSDVLLSAQSLQSTVTSPGNSVELIKPTESVCMKTNPDEVLTRQAFEVAKSSALHNIISRHFMTSRKATNHAVSNWLRGLPLFRSVQIIEKINRLTWEDFLGGLIVLLTHLLSPEKRQLIGILPASKKSDGTYELLYDKMGELLVHVTGSSAPATVPAAISETLRMKTGRLLALSAASGGSESDEDYDDMSDDESSGDMDG